MRKLALATFVALIGLVALLVGGQGSAGSHKHKVKADTLTGYQESAPAAISSPNGTGTFSATIDDDDQEITYTLTYVGLGTPATQAHVHFGNRFTNGGVSFFLCAGSKPCPPGTTTEAVVTGTVTPADVVGPTGQGIAPGEWNEIVAAMRSGVAYANVHTTQFPAGEIRGQINDDDQRQPE
jgi:hypothetical protein